LRTSLLDSSISELSATREFKMDVLFKLFVVKGAAPIGPRTLASRLPLRLGNQLASRFRHFWVA
jgi:hypothetical protein